MTFSTIRKGGLAAALGFILASGVSSALAQTAEAPAAPDAGRNNWAVNCGAGATADAPLVCQMLQNVVVAETNQRLLTVMIRPLADADNHQLTLALPHGVDFIKGVEMAIDDKAPSSIAVQTSNQQGAFANLPISDELLAGLRGGKSVKFTFHSVSGQTFSVPISLTGFSAAYEKLAAS